MNITNKTNGILSVPIPGGKRLVLGPGKMGQVTHKALDYPAVVKLIEAGDLEADDKSVQVSKANHGGFIRSGGTRHGGTGASRQSGDR